MAFGGMLTAIGVLLIVLSGVAENITLFLLALAAFLEGVMIRCFSFKAGVLYFFAVSFLGFILAPQKLYVFTFAAFGLYIMLAEFLESGKMHHFSPVKWIIKLLVYNAMLFAAFFGGTALFGGGLESFIGGRFLEFVSGNGAVGIVAMILFLQLLMVVFDRLYFLYMNRYGIIIRDMINKSNGGSE